MPVFTRRKHLTNIVCAMNAMEILAMIRIGDHMDREMNDTPQESAICYTLTITSVLTIYVVSKLRSSLTEKKVCQYSS